MGADQLQELQHINPIIVSFTYFYSILVTLEALIITLGTYQFIAFGIDV
jgi:hypothetical protein